MARQQLEVVTSDISGKQLTAGNVVTVVVSDHPLLDGRVVEIDADVTEVEKLEASKLAMVNLELLIPGKPVRRLTVGASAFEKLFKGDIAEVLLSARSSDSDKRSERKRRRPRGPATSIRGKKTDYTDPQHFGQLHRGRVTEQEAELVRANLGQANKNRAALGQVLIDPNDEAEKRRYGL